MKRVVIPFLGLIAMLCCGPAASAQRDATIPDPDPSIELRSFQVADGFEVNLFAADPLLAKPIQMNFDPAGRLWIAASEVYPQIQPGQVANDKVLILEDTNQDGAADRTTVFADGLLIPTGVEPGDGGAYVANSTELIHLRDSDGDGKADTRQTLLSGFGTEDTHHIIHTFRWGDDGNLYFNQSTYIHSHIETPYGVRRLGGGGIWQFHPETLRLEVFTRGLINPWGHQTDRWGQHFATDGAGGEGINFLIRGGSYAWTPNAPRIVAGLNPGSPKYCGLEVVSGRHMPDNWQGSLITNDFRAHRVCRFVLTEDGSGFASREQTELIKTTHPAFRPIDVTMGPDGAIYIADWYNPIIQHGEVDFRDPRRDHTHGRIWRVTAKGRQLVKRPSLVGSPVAALLDALKAPEDWTRRQAKRVLKERGAAEVVPALATWLASLDPHAADFGHNQLEALWTYQSLDVVEPKLLSTLLQSKEPRIRAATCPIVAAWSSRLDDPISLLEPLATDAHPRVRLEAVRALASIPENRSAVLALRALDQPMDRFLDYALWLTARELAPVWLPAVTAGTLDFDAKPGHLLFALGAVGSAEVVRPLLKALQSGKLDTTQRDQALALIAQHGQEAELGIVLDAALTENNPERGVSLLNVLSEAATTRKLKPRGDLARVLPLLDSKSAPLQAAAARAVGVWGMGNAVARLADLARSNGNASITRSAAIEGLARLGTKDARAALADLSNPDAGEWETRRQAVSALATLDLGQAAPRAVALLESWPQRTDASSFVDIFLRRKGGPKALAIALKGKSIAADVAKIGARLARGTGAENPELVAAFTTAGGLEAHPAPPTGAERERLLADVLSAGDPARGEALFRRTDLACWKCHAVAGAGGQVGPGLESIGASAPLDYLLDSLVDPSKAVKEGYHSLVIATTDGRLLNGIKLRQTETALVLRDADDREIAIPLADIDEQKEGGSLMPVGQVDGLTRPELLDLLRFLSELGKSGPYAVKPLRTVRRWRVLDPTPPVAQAIRRFGTAAALESTVDPALWKPAYSTIAGALPPSEIPTVPVGEGSSRVGFVQFQVEVTTAGAIAIASNIPTRAMELWIDGVRSENAPGKPMELGVGLHTITISVRPSELTEAPSVQLVDVPKSPARAQIATGK